MCVPTALEPSVPCSIPGCLAICPDLHLPVVLEPAAAIATSRLRDYHCWRTALSFCALIRH
jgi:hypothetical protein